MIDFSSGWSDLWTQEVILKNINFASNVLNHLKFKFLSCPWEVYVVEGGSKQTVPAKSEVQVVHEKFSFRSGEGGSGKPLNHPTQIRSPNFPWEVFVFGGRGAGKLSCPNLRSLSSIRSFHFRGGGGGPTEYDNQSMTGSNTLCNWVYKSKIAE